MTAITALQTLSIHYVLRWKLADQKCLQGSYTKRRLPAQHLLQLNYVFLNNIAP